VEREKELTMSDYSNTNLDPLGFEPMVNVAGGLDLTVGGNHPLDLGDVVTDTFNVEATVSMTIRVSDSKDNVMSVLTRGNATPWTHSGNASTRVFLLPTWNGADLDFYIDISALDGAGGVVVTRAQRVIIKHTSST
jgi:hypothetical protein